jgi:hypothetical protein
MSYSSRTIERERKRMDEFATRFPPKLDGWMAVSQAQSIKMKWKVSSQHSVSVLASLLLLI